MLKSPMESNKKPLSLFKAAFYFTQIPKTFGKQAITFIFIGKHIIFTYFFIGKHTILSYFFYWKTNKYAKINA